MDKTRLLFVTTTLGTKWESYSQALIERGFASQSRLLIDGTTNWSPLKFLDLALRQESDYAIHIDEDCFLYDPSQLERLISWMKARPDVALAGVPDGGHYYRAHNPAACNLFFVVLKTDLVRKLLASNPGWMNLKFEKHFLDNAELDIDVLDPTRIEYDDYEPYYGLFWAILGNGYKIKYLTTGLNADLLSTDVYFGGEATPMARHMWYLRGWRTRELGPYDRIPHAVRYGRVERDIRLRFACEPDFKRALRASHLSRAARGIRRAARRVCRAISKRQRARREPGRGGSLMSIRVKLGAMVHELPSYLLGVRPRWMTRSRRASWVRVRNRDERLTLGPHKVGARCNWRWTSDLHITRVFPALGQKLMRRALEDYPIGSEMITPAASTPDASFVVGHRGSERLPLLLETVRSISGQVGCNVECIVVEQSIEAEAAQYLPAWVRHIHTAVHDKDAPYNRSAGLNAGARAARGRLLILHDNDLLVPRCYAGEALRRLDDGFEIVNLKRFIFYLGRRHTESVIERRLSLTSRPPERVMQNAGGGGSIAVARDAYFGIGGFDESFVGWGGEDNEFWDRAQTRTVWPFGYLPMVHLWHPPQPGKLDQGRSTISLLEARSAMAAEQRIAALTGQLPGE